MKDLGNGGEREKWQLACRCMRDGEAWRRRESMWIYVEGKGLCGRGLASGRGGLRADSGRGWCLVSSSIGYDVLFCFLAPSATPNGACPETVAVNLWGLHAIKTKGECNYVAVHGETEMCGGPSKDARLKRYDIEVVAV